MNIEKSFLRVILVSTIITYVSTSFAECDCDKERKGIYENDIIPYFSTLDLTKHDAEFYGHTVEKHVGKSKDWLDGRLSGNRHQKFASSYTDIETANMVVKEIILANQEKIKNWIEEKDADKDRLVLSKKFDQKIGILLKKKDTEVKDCNVGVVVLKHPHRNTEKFYVTTSYPVLNIGDIEEGYQNKTNVKKH